MAYLAAIQIVESISMINLGKSAISSSLLILFLSGCQTVATTSNSDYEGVTQKKVLVEPSTASIATPKVDQKSTSVKVTNTLAKKKSEESTKSKATASTSSQNKAKSAVIKEKTTASKIESTNSLAAKPSVTISKTVNSVEGDHVKSEIEERAALSTNPEMPSSDIAVNGLKNDIKSASETAIEGVQEQADGMDKSLPINDAGVPKVAMLMPAAPISSFNLEQLPMTFNQWSLDIIGSDKCILTSTPIPMQDGQGGTKVVAEITDMTLVLKTRSMIDDSYKNTGIQINDNQQLPIERLYSESAILYSKQYADIMTKMRQEGVLTVSLGFWPTWPVTQTYQASINLKGFNQAFETLQRCRQELSKK